MTHKVTKLRPPNNGELADINALILRSKAVWGYDAAFMEACREELSISRETLSRHPVAVTETDGRITGVAELSFEGDTAHLEKLFVDPETMRAGAGRRLFDWAVEKARAEGAGTLVIEADPDAEGFYRAMGARRTGQAPSGSIPGRMLPELSLALI